MLGTECDMLKLFGKCHFCGAPHFLTRPDEWAVLLWMGLEFSKNYSSAITAGKHMSLGNERGKSSLSARILKD